MIAAVLMTGCSHAPAPRAVSGPRTTAAAAPPSAALDSRTCAGVSATVEHLTVATVRWSPVRDPFNPAIAAQIGVLSGELYREAPLASTVHVRLVIASNARAFATVAKAMHSRNGGQVTRAISATRVAYRGLKRACSLP